ncbi:hypothetical protein BpHYR1_014384 [Brachionus plicatilis]|uniref:Uncharacterized protein n=1 Tax=Brachionus plicatilis TaxID=10195 RepID=A0A3M7RL96_BRAPC|nr:hypothetical protein BpHYR1_014384 [Brachionus plicatilis]
MGNCLLKPHITDSIKMVDEHLVTIDREIKNADSNNPIQGTWIINGKLVSPNDGSNNLSEEQKRSLEEARGSLIENQNLNEYDNYKTF